LHERHIVSNFAFDLSFVVGYTMDTLTFNWLDNAVDVDLNLQLPQFTLIDSVKENCSQNYTAGLHMLKTI